MSLIENYSHILTTLMTNISLSHIWVDHSKGTVCSSGGRISDRPWTCHPLLVSLALIPLSPLCSQHLSRLCVYQCVCLCSGVTLHTHKIPFDLI